MSDMHGITVNNSEGHNTGQNIDKINIIKPKITQHGSQNTMNNNKNNSNKSLDLFTNKRYSCIGRCSGLIRKLIQSHGGVYVPTKQWAKNIERVDLVLVDNTIQWTEKNIKKAIGKNFPLVHSSYISKCIEKGIVLPHEPYLASPPHLVPQSSHSNSRWHPNKLRQKSKKLKNKINHIFYSTVNDNEINGSAPPSMSDIQEIYSILCKDDHKNNNNNNNNQSDESPVFFDCDNLSFPACGTSDGNMTREKFVYQLNQIGKAKDKQDNIQAKNNKKRTIKPSYTRTPKFSKKDKLHNKTSMVICPGVFNMKCDNLIDFKSDIECCNSCMNKLLTNINKT